MLSILIVGYNSGHFLPRCLDAAWQAAAGHEHELLYIDNSEDARPAGPDIYPGRFRQLASRGNIGFAAANNLLAREAKGDWLLLLNPDTEIEPDAIERMLAAVEYADRHAILGGTTITCRNPETVFPPLCLPTLSSIIAGLFRVRAEALTHKGNDKIIPENAVSGGFMLVCAQAWRELDGMDERFFLYGEDLDLCKRAADMGWKVGSVPAARVFHNVGSGAFFSPRRQLMQMRGNATYHLKHFGSWSAGLNIALLWLSTLLRTLGSGILAPFSKKYRHMFQSLVPLCLMPWRWCFGYPSRSENVFR